MAKRKSKDIYLMPEPKWQEIHTVKTEEEKNQLYRKFEYFVHYEVPDKKAGATVHTWLDKESGLNKELLKKLKKVPDMWFSSFSKYTFIWTKTQYMPDSVREYMLSKIPPLENKAEEIIEKQEEKKAERPKVSIQQRMREQVTELCAQWESKLDEMIYSDSFDIKKFDPFADMRAYDGGIVKPNHAKIIKDDFAIQHQEAQEVVEWEDEQIKEAYSFMNIKMRKQYLEFFEKINSACDTLINTGKAQRKTRKPKAVSKDRLVQKLKYQINDSALGIASVNPTDIIDASEVWVYNTKTRKLGVYYASGLSTGLSVKGTSIENFDTTKSVQKTLRKPAENLKLFKGNARTKYAKAFADIKTTDTKLNGRFNDNTVILKSF